MSEATEEAVNPCVTCTHPEDVHAESDAHCEVEGCQCTEYVAALAEAEDPDGPVVPQA